MAYIGAPPPDRILTTEDIEDGAVEMSDISWKNQPDNENLSGTIDSFTVKLAEKFTLTGDIAISKDLTLTKLADDGEALVLTTDASSRTNEGSGTISSNTFAQVPNASLTSMTGVLGSGVTGGSGINALGTVTSGTIGSGVDLNSATFPTGHIIQTVYDTETTETNTGGGTGWKNTSLAVAITPTATSSLIMITYSIVISVNTTGYSAITSVFRGDVSGVNLGGPSPDYGTAFHGTSHLPSPHSAVVIDTPSTTSATTYTIGIRESADNQTYYCSNNSRATIIVQELAG